MKSLAVVLFSLLTACGRLADDGDAGTDANIDASYDIDAHWGECCDRKLGGLGRACTATEIEAGPEVFWQCPKNAYCGIEPPDPVKHFSGNITCSGSGPPPAGLPWVNAVPWPPWPGGLEATWGDCCFFESGSPFGGWVGSCPADASAPHVQCSPNQYCGVYVNGAGDGGAQCCGDRSNDEGTLQASGLDPACMPRYWSF